MKNFKFVQCWVLKNSFVSLNTYLTHRYGSLGINRLMISSFLCPLSGSYVAWCMPGCTRCPLTRTTTPISSCSTSTGEAMRQCAHAVHVVHAWNSCCMCSGCTPLYMYSSAYVHTHTYMHVWIVALHTCKVCMYSSCTPLVLYLYSGANVRTYSTCICSYMCVYSVDVLHASIVHVCVHVIDILSYVKVW